jgi:hypothetical protein
MRITDHHGLTTFELFNGEVKEVEWKPASIFISSSPTDSQTTETYTFTKKEGAKYLKAINIKNAQRKFNP